LAYGRSSGNTLAVNHKKEYPEYRLGLDAKWDAVAGLWLESSWTHAAAPLGILRNQVLLTLGVDYTFSLGNGLHVVNENLIASLFDTKASLQQSLVFSGISLSYPLSLLDQVQTMSSVTGSRNTVTHLSISTESMTNGPFT
jgi:hypothetical protein